MSTHSRFIDRISLLLTLSVITCSTSTAVGGVDFQKQIQPILKATCWDCHGADTREAGLRLDQKASALAGGDTGAVIVPGNAAQSVLFQLVSGEDPDRPMPPDGEGLSQEQLSLLKTWINEGAKWPEGVDPQVERNSHWSYQPLQPGKSPAVTGAHSDHPIDHYILARLQQEQIEPSPLADSNTLIKRLYYDLLGLPPTPEAVENFVNDSSADAYESLVDELLNSPHFGERWGRHWLDLARYADSDGYEKDRPRFNAWKYRDWVIDAINDDMPFDQFTIEQLAGDLLPNATESQRLATAFNRQTLTNTEGGTDQEEFRVAAVMDRIETIGTAWLGLTVGCARCHSHKYDQISQREYYELFAFFNNADESNMTIHTDEELWKKYQQDLVAYEKKILPLREQLHAAKEEARPQFTAWLTEQQQQLAEIKQQQQWDQIVTFNTAGALHEAKLLQKDGGVYLASGTRSETNTYTLIGEIPKPGEAAPPQLVGVRLDLLTDDSLGHGGPGWADNGNFVLSELTFDLLNGEAPHRVPFSHAAAQHSQNDFAVTKAIDGNEQDKGWAIAPQMGQDHTATFYFQQPLTPTAGNRFQIRLVQNYLNHSIGKFRVTLLYGVRQDSLKVPKEIRQLLAVNPEKRNEKQNQQLFDHFTSALDKVQRLQKQITKLEKAAPFKPEMTVRVMSQRANNPRTTHVFKRGSFLDPLGPVNPGTLEVLPPLPSTDGETPPRLAFARWLVSAENPLTPRVVVNQIWTHLFGEGLVTPVNDFGVRGEKPSHPGLLDWLAAEFINNGWSRKKLIKTIVLSDAYQRASAHRAELNDVDPNNRLLYRQNRFRMEAEIIRDLYLASSGLLDPRIGGPSVFPPLPPGIADLSYNSNFKWGNSDWNNRQDTPHGVAPKDDIYRRGMYTFFKRTAAHPNLMTFDCPDSNTTCVRRSTSNTPLQALQTLNNHVFLDASRALARKLVGMSEDNSERANAQRIDALFLLCVARSPTAVEESTLLRLLQEAKRFYHDHPQDAQEICGDTKTDDPRLAAWIVVSRVVLNLDEFVTRE